MRDQYSGTSGGTLTKKKMANLLFQKKATAGVKVRDKTQLSLEKLKMEKVDSSSLVLENEQQQQLYEKFLDVTANQEVQALLAHK
ncbi:unnamed protein product [Lymnaea stagnalis]|uniref:Uncharacterized protein n=1 Tax=Lymnaea stagnalis TaxID=6523 RepID=A0AAV2II94_LYMST